eukprot:7794182-Lingulodinium_polyedra.AAC.1
MTWRNAAALSHQNPTEIVQYLISELRNPWQVPTPGADVQHGLANCWNLTEREPGWRRGLVAQQARIQRA